METFLVKIECFISKQIEVLALNTKQAETLAKNEIIGSLDPEDVVTLNIISEKIK